MLALHGAGQQPELYGCGADASPPVRKLGKKRLLSGQAVPSANEGLGARKACGGRNATGHCGAPGEVSTQQIEVPCLGALPGEERSVKLPDGRECLVRVPTDVTGDRFLLKWVPILPTARKRRRTVEPRVAAKDAKKIWKHADALIAARPSSALATSELLRLRRAPATRIFAPPADQLPAHDPSDTLFSKWAPVNSSDVGEMELDPFLNYDSALNFPETSSMVFSATSSTDMFGISDFLL